MFPVYSVTHVPGLYPREGSTTGTPAYMAPEMALGNRQVDERSDIYSLGCVAYWMLTGLPVFEGKTAMEVIVNHAKTPPVAVSKRSELRIPELYPVSESGTDKDRELRDS